MYSFRAGRAAAIIAFVSVPASTTLAHEGMMHIGRTSAGLLMITDFDFDDLYTLGPAVAPLAGWFGEEPVFKGVEADDPGADIYAISAAAKISVEVVAFSPGLKLWNHDLSGLISQPGETLSLGPAPFEDHTFWHLDSADPAFNPSAGEWTATFRIIDSGSSAYTPSANYTLRLTTPAPGGLSALGFGAIAAIRRRPR